MTLHWFRNVFSVSVDPGVPHLALGALFCFQMVHLINSAHLIHVVHTPFTRQNAVIHAGLRRKIYP